MSARDELALDIFLADNSNIPEETLLMDWADAPDQHRPYAQNIANGLIAKGYRKPRTITTVEELDALAKGTTILDAGGMAAQWDGEMWSGEGRWWHSTQIALPATVLHEPETLDPRAAALADPEGHALVQAIHDRKAKAWASSIRRFPQLPRLSRLLRADHEVNPFPYSAR